ncbi:MAG: hypothetical protein HYT80_06840 [Euryarchaeota archaeon]|nr:hypothetical protein [Euryarchaeota archaeon]
MAKATESSGNLILPSESAEAIKANLRQVAEEITRVRDRTREEAESLERIRGMLDMKYLTDLMSTVEKLETQVRKIQTTPPTAEAKRWKTELENEQRRLAKLWDAFKTQEDMLKQLQAERDDVLKEWKSLERQMENLGTPSKIKTRLATLEAQNQRLRNDASSAQARLEEYARMYAQEQERLAKLFKVYQDTQAKYDTLRKRAEPAKAAPAARKGKRSAPAKKARGGRRSK